MNRVDTNSNFFLAANGGAARRLDYSKLLLLLLLRQRPAARVAVFHQVHVDAGDGR